MTRYYRWDATLNERRRDDRASTIRPGATRDARNARDVGYHLAQMCRHRGLTPAQVRSASHVRREGADEFTVGEPEHAEP